MTLKAIRAEDPRKRISDGDGVYLRLSVNGGAHVWRFSYSFHGKRKLVAGNLSGDRLALARKWPKRHARPLPEASIRVKSARTTRLPFGRNGPPRSEW